MPSKSLAAISLSWSAACFAVAHIIVQGRIILVLKFLPGLVLGRLFGSQTSIYSFFRRFVEKVEKIKISLDIRQVIRYNELDN